MGLEKKKSAHLRTDIRYIFDGNALFLTATEAARSHAPASHFAGGGIIVAIGYPLNTELYDMRRRTLNLSPPTETQFPDLESPMYSLTSFEVQFDRGQGPVSTSLCLQRSTLRPFV
ncbi:unnamed protein product [Penicillium egyptiacum]|uniref:Uncharacterized protein n=1 Tax=Penicillium egyptiacum TaxID=1303716 RepID=A0A9W4KAB7_9EURO|nr:unnamed protein product [Penicillium egyptiacum]